MDWLTNLAQEAVELLPDVLRQPRLESFVTVVTRRHQLVEDALKTLQEGWWLVNLEGVQLDGLGELLASPRLALGDAEYELRLKARILQIRGNATPDDLLRLMATLQPTLQHQLLEYFPAALEMRTSGGPLPMASVHAELLQASRPAGVQLALVYQFGADAHTFAVRNAFDALTPSTTGTADAFPEDGTLTAPTAGFPSSGYLILDEDDVNEEVVSYSSITAGSFDGVIAAGISGGPANLHTAPFSIRFLPFQRGFGVSTYLSGNHLSGVSTLNVDSFEPFSALPVSGQLVLDDGTAEREVVSYSARTGTTFTLTAPTAYAHDARAAVTLYGEVASNPGGQLASVL